MTYKFTENTNNIQQQTTYILYMILGSYFHKCSFKKKRLEETLLLYYKEMPQKKQADLEEKVVEKAEDVLEDYLSIISEMNCEVDFYRSGKDYCLVFETGFERVIANVSPTGRYAIEIDDCKLAA